MRNIFFYCLTGFALLIPLSGCQSLVLYYATNTLDAPCTIRMKFSDKERVRYKKEIRYANITIEKVNSTTERQLKDTLYLKRISNVIIELTLPAKSTAIIDSRSSADNSLDSIFFIGSKATKSYSAKSYGKTLKVSGGLFTGFAQSLLYTIK